MRTILFSALCLFGMSSLFAQKSFEPGYYIDNSGKRTNAYISLVGLESLNANGATLETRLEPGSTSESVKASDIQEVGVGDDIKFRKFTVSLDDSDLHTVTTVNKHPDYKTKVLFLNVLFEADAVLYVYESSAGDKYFYSVGSKGVPVTQLMYKKYIYHRHHAPREVNTFRQQLFDDLKCPGDLFDKYAALRYTKSDLVEVFRNFATCNGNNVQIFNNKKKRKMTTHAAVYAGAKLHSFETSKTHLPVEAVNKFSYGAGFELQLRSSSRKWGAILRIEVEKLDYDAEATRDLSEFTNEIEHRTYEISTFAADLLAIGRYYVNPERKFEIYIDGGIGVSLPVGDLKYKYFITNGDMINVAADSSHKLDLSPLVTGAVGSKITEKLSAELRGTFLKQISNRQQSPATIKYSAVGINLVYSF